MKFSEYILEAELNEFDIKGLTKKIKDVFKRKSKSGDETPDKDEVKKEIESTVKTYVKEKTKPFGNRRWHSDDMMQMTPKQLDKIANAYLKAYDKVAEKAKKVKDPKKRYEMFQAFELDSTESKNIMSMNKAWNRDAGKETLASKKYDEVSKKKDELENKHSDARGKEARSSEISKEFEKYLPELNKKFPEYKIAVSFKPYHWYEREFRGDDGTADSGDVFYIVNNQNHQSIYDEKALAPIKAYATKNIVPKIFKAGIHINRVWTHSNGVHFSCFKND